MKNEISRIEERDIVKKIYGFDFPMKARYKRDVNRVYFSNDFKDGEKIQFFDFCEKPSSNACGYAYYQSCERLGKIKIIKINELEIEKAGGVNE